LRRFPGAYPEKRGCSRKGCRGGGSKKESLEIKHHPTEKEALIWAEFTKKSKSFFPIYLGTLLPALLDITLAKKLAGRFKGELISQLKVAVQQSITPCLQREGWGGSIRRRSERMVKGGVHG